MLGREDVASYEDLFCPLEWQAILTDDWSILDDEDEELTW
jgi:hypothetical protein